MMRPKVCYSVTRGTSIQQTTSSHTFSSSKSRSQYLHESKDKHNALRRSSWNKLLCSRIPTIYSILRRGLWRLLLLTHLWLLFVFVREQRAKKRSLKKTGPGRLCKISVFYGELMSKARVLLAPLLILSLFSARSHACKEYATRPIRFSLPFTDFCYVDSECSAGSRCRNGVCSCGSDLMQCFGTSD